MGRQSDMINALPALLYDNAEFNAIFNTEAAELDAIQQRLTKALNDQYIDTATGTAIERWEAMLQIRPDTLQDSLEQRRQRIKAKLLERIPFTVRTLCEKLTAILQDVPYTVELDHDKYELTITITTQRVIESFLYQQIDDTLYIMLPANILSKVQLARDLAMAQIYIGAAMQYGCTVTITPQQETERTVADWLYFGGYLLQGTVITISNMRE